MQPKRRSGSKAHRDILGLGFRVYRVSRRFICRAFVGLIGFFIGIILGYLRAYRNRQNGHYCLRFTVGPRDTTHDHGEPNAKEHCKSNGNWDDIVVCKEADKPLNFGWILEGTPVGYGRHSGYYLVLWEVFEDCIR